MLYIFQKYVFIFFIIAGLVPKKNNNKYTIRNKEGLVKWSGLCLKHIRIMWYRIFIIFNKRNPKWILLHYVPTHWLKLHRHTINLCCSILKIVHILLSEVRNQISITKIHPLQKFFMLTKCSNVVRFIGYIQQRGKNMYTMPPTLKTTKIYTRKLLVMMDKLISEFHTSV